MFGSLAMLASGILIIYAALGGLTESPRSFPDVAFGPTASPSPPSQPTQVPPDPTPAPSAAAVERIIIPKIGVDAPIVVLGVDPNGVMEAPNGPVEVAWYHFSSRPGWGGNAVFAGHVDYRPNIQAVFWHLRNLSAGDEITVRLDDGTTYTYRVISAATYLADDAPVQEIVGPTENEVVTLITCGGTFNPQTREYDKRLIVRAERVFDAPSAVRQ